MSTVPNWADHEWDGDFHFPTFYSLVLRAIKNGLPAFQKDLFAWWNVLVAWDYRSIILADLFATLIYRQVFGDASGRVIGEVRTHEVQEGSTFDRLEKQRAQQRAR